MSELAPYRDQCFECVELRKKIERFEAATRAMYPYQGSDQTEHTCVYCGVKLYRRDHQDRLVRIGSQIVWPPDFTLCNAQRMIVTCHTGVFFKTETKEVDNPNCPTTGIAHLHRNCWTCGAQWLEQTKR